MADVETNEQSMMRWGKGQRTEETDSDQWRCEGGAAVSRKEIPPAENIWSRASVTSQVAGTSLCLSLSLAIQHYQNSSNERSSKGEDGTRVFPRFVLPFLAPSVLTM